MLPNSKPPFVFWWKKGGVVNEAALKELEDCNYPIRHNGPSGYNKTRDKIRFLRNAGQHG